MSFKHTLKQIAERERQHRMTLGVIRKLKERGYLGITKTGNTDANGARLVVHDLIVYGVPIMVRVSYKALTPWELQQAEACGCYIQYGTGDIAKLCRYLDDAHVRQQNINTKPLPWSLPATPVTAPTVGTALPWLTDTTDVDD